MIKEIFFTTSNKNKLHELKKILPIEIKSVELSLEEIQETDVQKVAEDKAKKAFELTGKTVMVEDTGIYLDCLKGFPGALGRWMEKTCGYAVLCDIVKFNKNNSVVTKTCFSFFEKDLCQSFLGETPGIISETPKGNLGFGWDLIFIPEGSEKTQAEMLPEEKNSVSCRYKAILKLKEFLLKA